MIVVTACRDQSPTITTAQTTASPFTLPSTWTPTPKPPSSPTATVVPTITFTPEPTFTPAATSGSYWYQLTELTPAESVSLEAARFFIGIKIPPLPEGVTQEYAFLFPDGGELPSSTIYRLLYIMREGNARMLWLGVPFTESVTWDESRIFDAIPLPPTQAGDVLVGFTCNRQDGEIDSSLIAIAARPQGDEPATEIHYAWRVDPKNTTFQVVNDLDMECELY